MYNNYMGFMGNRMLPPGPQQYQPPGMAGGAPDKMYRLPVGYNPSEPYMHNGAMTGGEMRPAVEPPETMSSAVMPEPVQLRPDPFRGGLKQPPQPQQQPQYQQSPMNPFVGGGGFNPFMGGGGFNPYQQMNPFMGGGGFNPFMGMMGGFNPFMGGMSYGGFGGFNPYQQMNPFMGGYY